MEALAGDIGSRVAGSDAESSAAEYIAAQFEALGYGVAIEPFSFDQFTDYPATAFSWATVPGNPGLRRGHELTGRAVLGGLPAKPDIAGMAPAEIARRTRAAMAEMGRRYLLLGPDCSVNPDTPDALFQAAAAARAEG